MSQLVLREKDVQKILNVCRTDAYEVINEIREEYPHSKKLKGSKVRTEDLAHAYDLKVEDIYRTLKE
jgi:predicted DNA-binding transcriptional regulator AlpA